MNATQMEGLTRSFKLNLETAEALYLVRSCIYNSKWNGQEKTWKIATITDKNVSNKTWQIKCIQNNDDFSGRLDN